MDKNLWTLEEDEVLINFVKEHEELYNPAKREYRNPHLKSMLWKEVGEMLYRTDSDCMKRWTYIRDYYIRRKGNPGTGTSGVAAKKREELMSFLNNIPSNKRKISINAEDELPLTSSQGKSEDPLMEYPINQVVIMSETREQEQEKSKKKKKQNRSHNCDERLQIVKETEQQQTNPQETDETDQFFRVMAKVVKKLPRYEQIQLKMKISSLVYNAELRSIENSSSTPPSNSRNVYEVDIKDYTY